MICPSCGSNQIREYGDGEHWQCVCKWIFLKDSILEEEMVIREDGWRVQMVDQISTHVSFRVFCQGEDLEWYSYLVKCSKSNFSKV